MVQAMPSLPTPCPGHPAAIGFGHPFGCAKPPFYAVSRGRMHQMEQDGSATARRVNPACWRGSQRMSGALPLANIFLLLPGHGPAAGPHGE